MYFRGYVHGGTAGRPGGSACGPRDARAEDGDGLGECRPTAGSCPLNVSAKNVCVMSDKQSVGMALTEIDHVSADGQMQECIDNCFEAAQACE